MFPATSVALDALPIDFWQNASNLGWAIGSDIYSWLAFVVDLAL